MTGLVGFVLGFVCGMVALLIATAVIRSDNISGGQR